MSELKKSMPDFRLPVLCAPLYLITRSFQFTALIPNVG